MIKEKKGQKKAGKEALKVLRGKMNSF